MIDFSVTIENYQLKKKIYDQMNARYLQIYRRLKTAIISGDYAWNQRLPSKRQLAVDSSVSVITIDHAYRLLCDEGYAEARERSGYFVAYRDQAPGPDLSLPPAPPDSPGDVAENVDSPLAWPTLARAFRRTLSRRDARVLGKSPHAGRPELREAISRYLARARGLYVSPEQIVVGAGAEYLYGLLAQFFRGRTVAIEAPAYAKIRQVYASHGLDCLELPLTCRGIDSAALAAAGAGVLHVTPYRSYPTGATADASKRREYVRWAEDRRAWLIEDDIESEFSRARCGAETLFAADGGRRVIYINTFSRTLSASLRTGYLVLPEALRQPFLERVGFYSCPVPTIVQRFLADFIDSGEFERHLNRLRRRFWRKSAEGAASQ